MKKQIAQNGFTLIELLVVLAIIGILAGMITLAVNDARIKGRDAKRIGDARQFATAMEQYYTQYGAYPTGTASVLIGGAPLSDAGAFDSAVEPVVPNYLPFIPTAPIPADGSCAGISGKGGNTYWYETAPDGSTYTMTFCIGKDSSSWIAGTHYATANGIQ